MTAFTMQWSPVYGSTVNHMKKLIAKGKCDGKYGWPFASHKQANVGDDLYFRRSGDDRPGIVMRCRITGVIPQTEGCIPLVQFTVETAADLDGPPLISDAELYRIDAKHDWDNLNPGVRVRSVATEGTLSAMTGGPVVVKVEQPEGVHIQVVPVKPRRGIICGRR